MKLLKTIAFVVLLAFALSAPTFAEPYVGGAVGQAQYNNNSVCSGFTACDDTGSAHGIFAGWQFNKNVAAELGYTDLGTASASGTKPAGSPDRDGTRRGHRHRPPKAISKNVDVDGFELTAVGTLPIGESERFGLIGKIGAYHWGMDTANGVGSLISSDHDTGTGATYGVGAKYSVTKSVDARVLAQRYSNVGNSTTYDIDTLMLGVLYRF